MSSPALRKSTRGKKQAPLDLTNPKSQLAKCPDIKALVKEKVGKLSEEAQKELMELLPPCDQHHQDLKSALDDNPIFWSSLGEWHELLQSGELRPSKRTLTARDLEEIPFKDDNFERFWGERMQEAEQRKEEEKQLERKSKTTTTPKAKGKSKSERRGKKKAVVDSSPEAVDTLEKDADNDTKPKVERRGRKKAVVDPALEEINIVADRLENSAGDDTKPKVERRGRKKAVVDPAPEEINIVADCLENSAGDDTKPKVERRGRKKAVVDPSPKEDSVVVVPLENSAGDDKKPKVERRGRKKAVVDPAPEEINIVADRLENREVETKPKDDVEQPTDGKPTDDMVPMNDVEKADEIKPADDAQSIDDETKSADGTTSTDKVNSMDDAMNTEPKSSTTNDSTQPVDDTKPAGSNPETTTVIPMPITIPIHAPPSIVNRNRNSNSNTAYPLVENRNTIRLLQKPRPSSEEELLNYFDSDFQKQTAEPPKTAKRPRKKTKKPTVIATDDYQYSDGDSMDTPASKRTTRSRTVSN